MSETLRNKQVVSEYYSGQGRLVLHWSSGVPESALVEIFYSEELDSSLIRVSLDSLYTAVRKLVEGAIA